MVWQPQLPWKQHISASPGLWFLHIAEEKSPTKYLSADQLMLGGEAVRAEAVETQQEVLLRIPFRGPECFSLHICYSRQVWANTSDTPTRLCECGPFQMSSPVTVSAQSSACELQSPGEDSVTVQPVPPSELLLQRCSASKPCPSFTAFVHKPTMDLLPINDHPPWGTPQHFLALKIPTWV